MNIQGVNFQSGPGSPAASAARSSGEGQKPIIMPLPGGRGGAVEARKIAVEEEKTRDEMPKMIDGINAVLSRSGSHIRFAEHQDTQRLMVQVLDDSTGEVLRTIPTKEMLDLAARISEMIGIFLDKET